MSSTKVAKPEGEEKALIKAIAEGMEDVRQGRVFKLEDVKKRLRTRMNKAR